MNRENIIWWSTAAFWIGIATVLWVRAYRVGKRDEKRQKQREEVLEDQRLLLMIADFITAREARKQPAIQIVEDGAFADDDLYFQLRRSVEMQQEKIDNNRPLAS